MRRAVLFVAVLAVAPWAIVRSSAQAPDLAALLARVGDAVERYYARAQSIMCVEEVTTQTLKYDMSSDSSFARRLIYDLRVAWDASVSGEAPVATIQRELRKVNNRAPRPKDKPECLDPTAVSPDALQMFLPRNQADYVFTIVGPARAGSRAAIVMDYRPRSLGTVIVQPHDGREACWSVDFPGHVRGRVWVDAETAEILRLDERLNGFVDVTLPADRRRGGSPLAVVFERADTSTVYRPVNFADPEETVMLPYSVDSTSVIRNAPVPRVRIMQRYSNYRRFTTGGRIVEDP